MCVHACGKWLRCTSNTTRLVEIDLMRIVKPVVGILAVVGLYAAAGYLAVPAAVSWAVKNKLPAALNGSSADVGRVAFNPWTWRLNIQNLVVKGAQAGSDVLRMDELQTKIDVRAYCRRTHRQCAASELRHSTSRQRTRRRNAGASAEKSAGRYCLCPLARGTARLQPVQRDAHPELRDAHQRVQQQHRTHHRHQLCSARHLYA